LTLQPRKLPAVQIQLPQLSVQENRNLAAHAGRLQGACGCAVSGFFMSATVVTMLLWYFASGHRFSDITLQHVLSLTGSIALAALCGKTLGLLWARWQLLALAASMHGRIVRGK